MDKFGIFKLLNSFLTAGGQTTNEQNEQKNSTGADFINAVSSFLQSNNTAKPPTATPVPPEQKKVSPPLQASMLNTMQSHDAFVKRVKDKNPLV